MTYSYDELQGSGEPKDTETKVQVARGPEPRVEPLPLEPKGSISRAGQDTYRRETSRDSVTGSFRTYEESKGLSTTRTK